ncbi:hypothetical protein [Paenibacillus beijingensis]|uniref:hypothetical protein n=1 Tax=Paenibacillus beijingensis TaxID=1126833 RepID=UPI0006969E01|nr:hypothetical protein [Paenibacillus beijingensis]
MDSAEFLEVIKKNTYLAIKYAKSFEVDLNFEERTINDVERILEYYSTEFLNATEEEKPTENQIWSMAVIWGTYVGELMKKTIGEPCMWIYEEGEFLLEVNKAKANPIGKAYKRIVNGPEDNIVSFYDLSCMKFKEYINTGSW